MKNTNKKYISSNEYIVKTNSSNGYNSSNEYIVKNN